MRGSLKIITIAGIGIYIHWTFLILLAWIAGIYAMRGEGLGATLQGLGFIGALFVCVVLHELGHALMARRFAVPTRDITLLPIGGVARLQRMPEKPMEELLVAIAGPLVNVALAIVFFVIVLLTHPFGSMNDVFDIGGRFFEKLMYINVALFVFNMLPAFPMDGGRILRAGLASTMDYVRATRIAAVVGQTMAFLFGLIGLFWNPILILIAIFVFLGAKAEADSVRTRSVMRGSSVRDALMSEYQSLRPDDRLSNAIGEVLSGPQHEFPVLRGGSVVGILTVQRLLEAVSNGGSDQSVERVMQTECPAASPDDDLADTVRWMRENHCTALPVVERGELLGLLTMESVMEWMQVQMALRGSSDPTNIPKPTFDHRAG